MYKFQITINKTLYIEHKLNQNVKLITFYTKVYTYKMSVFENKNMIVINKYIFVTVLIANIWFLSKYIKKINWTMIYVYYTDICFCVLNKWTHAMRVEEIVFSFYLTLKKAIFICIFEH